MNFTLRIIGPDDVYIDQEVDEACFRGTEGYFTILANHAPYISKLVVSSGYFLVGRDYHFFNIKSGFCTMEENVCTVITSDYMKLDVKNTSEMFNFSAELAEMNVDDVNSLFEENE